MIPSDAPLVSQTCPAVETSFGCPAVLADVMGDALQSVSTVSYTAGCSLTQNRIEIMWSYEQDGKDMQGWMAFQCYCLQDGTITQQVKPGFDAWVQPMDSPQFKPCN